MGSWAYVGIGGALGAMLRHACQLWLGALVPTFPAGTAVVNALGSALIGLLVPLLPQLPEATRPLVIVGVLGGFTTMSSFSLEVVSLLDQNRPLAAGLHWAGGAVLGIALCAVGYFAGSKLAGVQVR